MEVTDIQFTSAHADARGHGLLGYLKCTVGRQLRLDGLTLRKTLDDRLVISFPERKDRSGRGHPYIRPISDEARAAIQQAVLQALNLGGDGER